METGNGHVASTVSLFFTNDERRITSNVAFDSESDNSWAITQKKPGQKAG